MADVESGKQTRENLTKAPLTVKDFYGYFIRYWRTFFALIWPLLMLIIIWGPHSGKTSRPNQKFRFLYCLSVMGGYWLTGAIPAVIVGTMPIYMFPMLNVMDSFHVCACYFHNVNMLFVGSIFFGAVIKNNSLPKRFAYLLIRILGYNPRFILLSFIILTMMLSSLLENTCAVLMLLPIVKEIIDLLASVGIGSFYASPTEEERNNEAPPRASRGTTAFYLGVAFSATASALIMPSGSSVAIGFMGITEKYFPENPYDAILWMPWFLHNIIAALLLNVVIWVWLQICFMGLFRSNSPDYELIQKAKDNSDTFNEAFNAKYAQMGRMKMNEVIVIILWIVVVGLWMFRVPWYFPGWASLLVGKNVKPVHQNTFIKSSSTVFGVVIFALVFPTSFKCIYSFSKNSEKRPQENMPSLVSWKNLVSAVPWNMLFVIGSGIAISYGFHYSSCSYWVIDRVKELKCNNKYAILLASTLFTYLLTEVMDNAATANMVIPIMNHVSQAILVTPIYYGYPHSIAASLSFLFPKGSTSSVAALEFGNLRTRDMVIGGFVPKLFGVLIIFLFPFYGGLFYDLETFPSWAKFESDIRDTDVKKPLR